MRISGCVVLVALSTAPAALLSGCATSPIQVSGNDLAPDHMAPPRRPRSPALPLVVVGPVEDRRGLVGGRNVTPATAEGAPGAAGGVAGRLVSTVGLPEQVHADLLRLSSPGFDVEGMEEAGADAPVLALHPRLLKAYMTGLGVTLVAVVIIEIEYVAADGTTSTRAYRGQYSAMNWASTKSEVRFAMRSALDRCLEQVRADLERRLEST